MSKKPVEESGFAQKMTDKTANPTLSTETPGNMPETDAEDFFTETSELSKDAERSPEQIESAERDPELPESAERNPELTESVERNLSLAKDAERVFTGGTAQVSGMPESADEPGRIREQSGNTEPQRSEITAASQMNLFEEKILTVDNRSRFRIIGQVFETYWLIQFEEQMMMIDQHAAHEKVNYERLMRQYHEKNIVSQTLMPPVIVSLSGQEETVLKDNMEVFAALGFEVEDFGGSEYALRSVPVDLYGCNEREMFLEVLDQLAAGTSFGNIHVIEEKIASMSCKAAVKGNNLLSFAEAEALIDELLTLENPYNCPHGRPTIVTMTKAEMDKKFKRIV